MRRVPAGRVFKTDYTNLDEVIQLAKSFGEGTVVVKFHHRPNYNITHTQRARNMVRKGEGVIVYTVCDA